MKLKKIRNALLVVLTLALVSATAVAITWAATSPNDFGNKDNTFTNNPKITTAIREETFDGLDYDGKNPVGGINEPAADTDIIPSSPEETPNFEIRLPDGTQITTVDALGTTLADSYMPDQDIPKNPSMKNNTPTELFLNTNQNLTPASSDEWVAMSVDYKLTVPATYYTVNANVYYDENGYTHKENGAGVPYVSTDPDVTAADGTLAHPYVVTEMKSTSTNTLSGHTIKYDSYDAFATALAQVTFRGPDDGDADELPNTVMQTGSTAVTENRIPIGFNVGSTKDTTTWKDISTDSKKTLWMYNKILNNTDAEATESTPEKVSTSLPLFDGVRINNTTAIVSIGNGPKEGGGSKQIGRAHV